MILIDYKDRRPIYEQVVEKLSELMVRGILEQNSQLPSVRSLATELSINPNTIQSGTGAAGVYLFGKGQRQFCGRESPNS